MFPCSKGHFIRAYLDTYYLMALHILTLNCIAATPKAKDEFHICPDGSTILKKYICDGYKDCRDNSDELNCPAGKLKLKNNLLMPKTSIS